MQSLQDCIVDEVTRVSMVIGLALEIAHSTISPSICSMILSLHTFKWSAAFFVRQKPRAKPNAEVVSADEFETLLAEVGVGSNEMNESMELKHALEKIWAMKKS